LNYVVEELKDPYKSVGFLCSLCDVSSTLKITY